MTTQEMSAVLDGTMMLKIDEAKFQSQKTVRGCKAVTNTGNEITDDYRVVIKKLGKSPELSAITTCMSQFRNGYLRYHTLPSPFRMSIHAVPLADVENVEIACQQHQKDLEPLIDAFVDGYPAQVAEVLSHPDTKLTERDFPSPDVIRGHFRFEWSWFDLGLGKVKSISMKVYRAEMKKQMALAPKLKEQMVEDQRLMFSAILTELRKRITAPSGEKLIFRNSVLDAPQKFVEAFAAKNALLADDEMASYVKQVHELTAGVTPDVLRSDDDYREHLAKEVGKMGDAISDLVANGTRAIELED